ncbi:prepilin-type N-terminal cleavage/methylation domain-containing protein [Elongatibacter sediminis]|uniref:Prepilin-type N-terminal cleavage/methylation domain-containing protein n=1 Tax=Elongatibacter sediminis TaxID=3119006 RepID=A0AAW9RGH9_9GAMM
MKRRRKRNTNRRCIERHGSGFSLVEVMVAAVVFALGLAGVSLMLMQSVQGSVAARDRSTAVTHADVLAELILMNPGSLGHFMAPEAPATDCVAGAPCGDADWAAGNFARWQFDLRQSLASAEGVVCRDDSPEDGDAGAPACSGSGPAVVKVFWTGPVEPGLPGTGTGRFARTIAE